MTVTPVTPRPGLVSQIATGGNPVEVIPANPNGGFITNPATATETLFVNPVADAELAAGGTTFGLAPGQTWTVIPGQTTATTCNAASSGHGFSAIYW